MTILFKCAQHIFLSCYNTIDELCKPNPKYTPKLSDQEIDHQRNKSVVVAAICILTYFTLDTIVRQAPVTENLDKMFFCALSVFYLFFSCKYHPQIFKIYYTLVVGIIFGPSLIYSDPKNIYVSVVVTLMVQIFVQLVTGSFVYFFITTIAQNILLNTFYQEKLREALYLATPDEVLSRFSHAFNMVMALQFMSICLIGYFMDHAREKALEYEQKKTEAENQKVFLLGFSHELRNFINSLTGNVKLASLEPLGDRAKEFIRNAELCGELLVHMINNILDTGKSQINELEINLSPTPTYDSFERIWAVCSELIKRKDLAGCMTLPNDLPGTLMLDHHRLTQIFLNLVGNSVKFTDKGSINITVEWLSHQQQVTEECFQPYPFNSKDDQDEGLYEKQARFSTLDTSSFTLTPNFRQINKIRLKPAVSCKKGVLKMTVCDTGCGMTQTQIDRLFQKFSQVTVDEGKKKLGTGLGLFITKELCHRMDGEVKAFSEKDKGSAFIICLPMETAEDKIIVYDDIATLKQKFAPRNLKVMIVDDALTNHVILKNFFGKIGIYTEDIAVNGLEAYQKYVNYLDDGHPIHIITMDLDMPIMDGKEASQKIRELEKQRCVEPCFLLMISGNCVESEMSECLDQTGKIRADAFIRKPIRIEELIQIVTSRFIREY